MTVTFHFDAPAGGTDANRTAVDAFRDTHPQIAAVLEDPVRTRWTVRGSDRLVVSVDVDPGNVTQEQIDTAVGAIETVYGVGHQRTVTE